MRRWPDKVYTIDTRPSVLESRIYRDEGGYKDRSPFIASLVTHVVNDVAYVTLLTGICDEDECNWSPEIDTKFFGDLKALGIERAVYEHKGKTVVRDLVG